MCGHTDFFILHWKQDSRACLNILTAGHKVQIWSCWNQISYSVKVSGTNKHAATWYIRSCLTVFFVYKYSQSLKQMGFFLPNDVELTGFIA